MINLPILDSLDVSGYGLYPGDNLDTPGLHVRFDPGLTLILGGNGLGKTTLVTMLFRLLTGPFDISILMRGTDLGNANLQENQLNSPMRRLFAQRVADGAAHATARLVFHVGGEEVTVERDLRNIALRSFKTENTSPSQNEQQYQADMVRLANVSSFRDWILLLRYIVFYFEDRRSLVWDASAQRQLLRILFLDPEQANDWTLSERDILEADSEVRNLHAVATSEERHLAADEVTVAKGPALREELHALEDGQRSAYETLEEINSRLPDVEARHEADRLRFLTLEQERESRYRELERAQLRAVNARLPQHSDSARYILAQILTEAQCLVCGQHVPSVMSSMESRIRDEECIVCGSDLTPRSDQTVVDPTGDRIDELEVRLHRIDAELDAARGDLDESETERNHTVGEIQELRSSISEHRAQLDAILIQLPLDESDLHQRRSEFLSLRGRIEVLQRDLNEKRSQFDQFVRSANATIEQRSIDVRESFVEYANQFLFEDCRLIWSPQSTRLGQTGRRFDFPSFELELGGSDFSGTVRRSGPSDVSESQREFIDLAFRMALAKVATKQKVTSLVMDAPESSLDAVFVNRAAEVLGSFGRRETGNRLVITSNLVAGELIPSLLRKAASAGDRSGRVVNLLAIATPTTAMRNLKDQYEDTLRLLMEQANAP